MREYLSEIEIFAIGIDLHYHDFLSNCQESVYAHWRELHKSKPVKRQRAKLLRVSFSVTEIEVERFEISCILLYSPIKGAFATISGW